MGRETKWESDKSVIDEICDKLCAIMENIKVKSERYFLNKTYEAPLLINSFVTDGDYS